MRVVVTVEMRFIQTPDNAVWTYEGPAYGFWRRYLSAFEKVRVVARVKSVPTAVEGAHRVDGPGVEVWPVPYYHGPQQYLLRRVAVGRAVRAASDRTDAVIVRAPSPIGSLLAAYRLRQGLPYALEVIGDPHDVYAPGVIRHPARPFLRRHSTARLRQECKSAAAVSYVTGRLLQTRYPARQSAVTANYSSVDLPAEAFVTAPRTPGRTRHVASLVSVGSLEQMYKGIDTLLEALACLTATNTAVRLVHVGDGMFRPRLERLAARIGVADRVTFVGRIPAGAPVRKQLDAADLFVLPSRTEGLPRALIEAMARGLPAIGTNVGGIPELLTVEDLVPPEEPAVLAAAVGRMLADPARMVTASARNLTRAREYSADALAHRREAFYRAVAELTRRPARVGGHAA